MIVVLAIDGLELKKVEEFGCDNLKQKFFGKTNIDEYEEPRTMVLWSSFSTGENKESEVLIDGKQEMWDKQWARGDTFYRHFKSPIVLDLPGYSYEQETHQKSRKLLKDFFMTKDEEAKTKIREEYNKDAFDHHRTVKEQFEKALIEDHDFVLGYFSLADVIGHLNFGNNLLMKMVYKEFDEIAGKIQSNKLIILSDHGMEGIGMFGDHSRYGFWSTNFINLETPKITDFGKIIEEAKE